MTAIIGKELRKEILADYRKRLPKVVNIIKSLYRSRGIEITDEQVERILDGRH